MSAVTTTINNNKKAEQSEKLTNQLLECVQNCQKKFGGRKQLATEYDSCVVAVCITLELILCHGLRNKPLETPVNSTLKQVSDIVTSLHKSGDILSCWPFISKHLIRHESERFDILKQIWTDTGKCRAWIRSSLNEHSLERYLIAFLSNSTLLKNYYEEWAILRDSEKSPMLPNMAAGLGSILFAISIDKPELNSSSPHNIESPIYYTEPVIEAPIKEPSKSQTKEKKKRKVARQLISFDEDSLLSSSVLSTSGSVSSSGTSSSNEMHLYTPHTPKDKNFDLSTNKFSSESKRDTLGVNSGVREKYSTKIPESMTPINQEIGELTPISTEINENFETENADIGTVEAASDISAVLTAVEIKNKEEQNKLIGKIEFLMKENETLKEQVQKYLGAIRMLNKEDLADSELDLDKLKIGEMPDYKAEAKLFEKKLVQVADLHAELMDFNNRLQQLLYEKDATVEKLNRELEILRGPMSPEEINLEENLGSVNVWIPSAFLTGSGSNSHHVYQIFLRAGNDEWNIYRRYAQFYALHSDLKKIDPAIATFDFPPKKSLRNKDSSLVEDRRKRLQIYLRRVMAHWPELSHCTSKILLQQHLEFFRDQNENNANNRKSTFTSRNDNHYTGL